MDVFAPHATDGYKLGHPSQYAKGTDFVSSNFTPRDFGYAPTTPETKTGKMVYAGLQYAIKDKLVTMWQRSFFMRPKSEVLHKYARRIKGYLGTNQGRAAYEMMSKLHDLGYLPIRIKSLPEGSRVNPGIPVFTITNTIAGFGALVNYLETILSNTVWPICNAASLTEQYYLLAKKYGELTGASKEFWLPLAAHNFALRGHRGLEDGIMSAFGHSLFQRGTDTFAVIDFAEDYYGATDSDVVGVSVNATEHATVCQQIAVNGGGHEGEKEALRFFLTEEYPTGVFSYVADSRDYYDLIGNIVPALKDVILSRGPNVDGQPGVLTIRPDSSKDTPYEVLLGYKVMEVTDLDGDGDDFANGGYNAARYQGKLYRATVEYTGGCGDSRCCEPLPSVVLDREMSEAEAKGTLTVLWDTFGGSFEQGSDGRDYRLLDSHIRVIYGEAISLQMAAKIYKGMVAAGWCVGSVFFGVGSWAFLGNSSRDSYGVACKATNSVVNGEEVALQKDPKGTSTFKKSAKGRLRVEKEGDCFVLYDNQTPEQEDQGELRTIFEDNVFVIEESYAGIKNRLHG